METLKKSVEDIALVIINGVRSMVMPVFNKYVGYYKYFDILFYVTYAIVLFGFYNTTPEYIPVLRNTILYVAVIILLIRFNPVSWYNPRFIVLGGNKFSEFDRKLIMSLCTFILFTHIVSEAVESYAKDKINQTITQPINKTVVQPIYNYIDTSGGGSEEISSIKKFFQEHTDGDSHNNVPRENTDESTKNTLLHPPQPFTTQSDRHF